MRKNPAKRPLGRRIVALTAAYAIALSSLLASFGAARAAAAAAAEPGGILCHSMAGQPSPATDESNSKTCADCCSVGCLMLMAALPPPPVNAVPLLHLSSQSVEPLAAIVLAHRPDVKSHRSRAPPQTA